MRKELQTSELGFGSIKGFCANCGRELEVDKTVPLTGYSIEDGRPIYYDRPRLHCPRFICRLRGFSYWVDENGKVRHYQCIF